MAVDSRWQTLPKRQARKSGGHTLSLSNRDYTGKEKEEKRKTAANGPKNVLTQSTIVITLQTKLSAPFCWLSSLSFSTIYSRLLLLLQLFSIAFFRCQIAHLLSLRPSGGNLLFITRQMASILMFFSLFLAPLLDCSFMAVVCAGYMCTIFEAKFSIFFF